MSNKTLFIIFIVISSILLFNSPRSTSKGYNIILIDIDSLRADHMEVYGYQRNTTPNIENFAKESMVFQNTISQSVWTLSSVASVFTSKYPSTHGVISRNDRIHDGDVTLAEVLRKNGYTTQAFVGGNAIQGGDMLAIFGFSKGFDNYNDWNDLYFNVTMPLAIDWLTANKDKKFFLFLHSYDVHDPYHKPAPYENFFDPNYTGFVDKLWLTAYNYGDITKLKKVDNKFVYINGSEITVLSKADINHIIAHYDGNILYTDYMLSILFKQLDKLNLTDKTIIVIYSNHGETLTDHVLDENRVIGHSAPYEEVIHVPLIIKHPKFDNKVIEKQAQLIDIMPTLLDFLNINKIESLQGKSLLPLIQNDIDVNFYTFSEGFQGTKAIRTLKWKLIKQFDQYELYDLENDKKELTNVVDKFPESKNEMETKMLLRLLR